MEDVLDVYSWSYDSRYPTICFDETNKQLVKDVTPALPMAPATADKPGQVKRYDHHYERNGTANIFVFFEPQRGWRHLKATQQRTKQDFAHCMRELVDEHYPEAACVTVVMDNLNTHHESSLYETFEPAEARRILNKLDIHYTPKHGSWLNMAEIELSVLDKQYLDQRIPDMQALQKGLHAYQERRNRERATVNWRFTVNDARTKLHRLYPPLTS